MCADDTAELYAVQSVDMAFPEGLAVLDVLLQHVIGESGVAKLKRHGIVHAVACDLLDQKIVGLLGTAGFAEHGELTVSGRDDRLDVENAASESGSAGNAAALPQVLEGVDHGDQGDLITLLSQMLSELVEPHPFRGAAKRILRENSGSDRNIHAVHDADVRKILRCNAGALICTRQARGDCDHNRLFTSVLELLENFNERIRCRLACLGELFAGDQLLIKSLLIYRDAVNIIRLTKRHGKRYNGKFTAIFLRNIYCGIDNDLN